MKTFFYSVTTKTNDKDKMNTNELKLQNKEVKLFKYIFLSYWQRVTV